MAVQLPTNSKVARARQRRTHATTKGCLLGVVVLALCHKRPSSVGAPTCWISGLRLLPTPWWSYSSSQDIAKSTRAGIGASQRLDGVVERLRHPFAEIRLSLPNGTSALGSLHVTKLRKGWVEDISEHLSVGDDISVSIPAGLVAKRGRLPVSAYTSLTEGKQVSGTVQTIDRAGLVVGISNSNEEVLLPWGEGADDLDDVHVGTRIGSLWIMSIGERRLVGTLRPTLTPEARKKFAEVMEQGHVFDGVVKSLKHPWAYMKVTLADGTSGLGSFHAAELCRGVVMNISECIVIGDVIPVKILNVAVETGHLSLSAYTSLAPGQMVHGTVSSIEESGNLIVSIRNAKEEVFVPRSEIANNVSGVKVGRAVGPLWIMSVTDGSIVGTFWPGRAMTADTRAKFASLAEPGEVFEGVIKHIKHPLAYLMVTLRDGTSGLGTFHAAELRSGLVVNISEHLSLGEVMPVSIRDGSIRTGRLSLSAHPSLTPGQQVIGTVQRVEASHGIVVAIHEGEEEVLLPWTEGADDIDDVKVGSTIGPLWIMKVGLTRAVGTLWPGRAMTPEIQAKFTAAMEPGSVVSGIVKHVKHPWACVMVTLEDGSSAMGRLHASQVGDGSAEDISKHLSIGDRIPVNIMEVSAEPGRPARSGCSSLTAGQEVIGTVQRVDASGDIVVEMGNGEKVLIRHSEYAGAIHDGQVGNTIGPIGILRVGVSGRRTTGTLWKGRAMTPEVEAKFAAAMTSDNLYDGVVKHIKHPWAFLKLTLTDGTSALGSLHAAELRRGVIMNISEHLSEGETIPVSISESLTETGRLALSARISLTQGQEVSGKVQRQETFGSIVVTNEGTSEEVLVPWSEGASDVKDLDDGGTIERLWIMSVGPPGGRIIGTRWPGRAMSPDTQAKFAAAVELGHVFDGVVKHVKHPWAFLLVTLRDGTAALGSLHAAELRKGSVAEISEHVSIGEIIQVQILDAGTGTGRLSLSSHVPLMEGQEVTGRIQQLEAPHGIVVAIDNSREEVLLPWSEGADSIDDVHIGTEIGPIVIMSVGPPGGRILGTLWPGKSMTPETQAKFAAVIQPGHVFNGVVEHIFEQHPWAYIRVTLPDGTSGLGSFQERELLRSGVRNISEHLSLGDYVPVHIDALGSTEQGGLVLSPCISVQAAAYKSAGSVISAVWTGQAIHSEIQTMYTAAMKPPRVFDGIVESVTHSFTSITVMLPDAPPAQGYLHAVQSSSGWGMSERLSVGDRISVRTLGVDLEQGVLLLHE